MSNNVSDIRFLIQYNSTGSSSRGKLAGGILLTLDDLSDEDCMKSVLRGAYHLLYAYPRGNFDDIIHMRKEEFTKIFVETDRINSIKYLITDFKIFRKEIYDTYNGIDKPKHKKLTKLIPGHLYLDADGTTQWIYIGNLTLKASIDREIKVKEYNGNWFIPANKQSYYTETIKTKLSQLLNGHTDLIRRYCLKTKKQLIEDLGEIPIDYEYLKDFTVILPKTYIHSYERKLNIQLK